ncbi:xanthine dehydrogenase family protein molybdopterin-binding subunit [Microbulbifer bruguierae]|uniref:Xanthine dehydrogenase family protein molybdopterin-binding subunit n=1 Tax=Microbulbifer bruguierae TaxID=3029061 RepID=A0ABY8NH92_9GAMM|nr:xanthine dehydrogenase family protein molybdopterin-binding subunit [Microbulbifer bruguierae]WGL16893.1 xanthine dehydrogenase family protein molybdopterin-binding subunit [Microbulbifer bruguierae]
MRWIDNETRAELEKNLQDMNGSASGHESRSESRRNFLKVMGGVGAGLTLAIGSPGVLAKILPRSEAAAAGEMFAPNAFVRIGADNRVAVVIKHVEMGQGTYTGLASLVAEELDADWEQIDSVGAPADGKRYNNLHWGPMQGTGGSSAIANSYQQMRIAGATAKAMLIAAAAQRWNLPAAEIMVKKGVVSHPGSGKQASFGELAELAATIPVPDESTIRLKAPGEFTYIGQPLPRKDVGKTDGTAVYTQDMRLDGMLTAMVAHPPRFGAKVKSFDAEEAKASNRVVDVIEIPTGIAVIARDYWSAKVARDKLKIDWDESRAMTRNTEEMMAEYRARSKESGSVARNDGDVQGAFATAHRVIEATYEFPYLAHAAMEPMNCVALVNRDSCEIWNGEQFQSVDQMNIGKLLGLPAEKVKLNMLFAGGSFGRRANPVSDYLVEAVHIAREKMGTPVKLVWSREDDMHAGYFRPAYVHRVRGGMDAEGNIVGWEQHIVGQSILTGTVFGQGIKNGVDHSSVEGASTLPYAIPNLRVAVTSTEEKVPVQWWRSVGHTHTAYSTETFIDELAVKAGQDPLALRMKLLADHPRWQGVLKLAADKAGWSKTLPKGWGRGVAVHESFNTYVAQVAEVSVAEDGKFKVERVVCAVDCGVPINPDVIRAQMEGGIGFGLAPALVSAITFKDGKVVESNFHNYQVLRINQMPEVEVHIVPSAEPPTGVGEPGVPPIAPAVANALAAATGKRYYTLPIKV